MTNDISKHKVYTTIKNINIEIMKISIKNNLLKKNQVGHLLHS